MMIDFVLADVMPVLGRCLPNLLICQYTMVDGNHGVDVKPIFSTSSEQKLVSLLKNLFCF